MKQKNIKLTYEKENNNSLPYLHILISRSENSFKTSVYHKPTCGGVYSNFNSFIYDQYKIGLIFTLLFRTFLLSRTFLGFTRKTVLKEILRKNAFRIKLGIKHSCIKTFLTKKFLYTLVAFAVKKKLFIALPYLGNLSLAIRTGLQDSIKNLPFCKIKVIFKSTTCLSKFFRFKDKAPFNLRGNVVYKFSCGRCNATYYGGTCRHYNVKSWYAFRRSPLTGKSLRLKQLLLLKIICFFAIT